MRRLLLIILFALPLFGVSRTWTGTTHDGKVSTLANWTPSTGSLAAGDNLTFNGSCSGADCAVTFDSTLAFRDVTVASAFGTASGTITQSVNVVVTGNLTLSANVWTATGRTVTFNGNNIGGLFCTGNFNTLTNPTSVVVGKGISGVFTLGTDCTLTADFSTNTIYANVIVQSGATLVTTGNLTAQHLTNSGALAVNGTVVNVAGTLTNSGTLDLTSVTTFSVYTLINNVGATITYPGSSLTVYMSWTQSGTFDITGKTLTFGSGNTTFNCTGDFNATTGVGSVLVPKGAGSAFILTSGCTLTADFSGSSAYNSVTVQSGATLITPGNFISDSLTNAGSLTVNGTTVSVAGTLTNSGTINLPSVTTFTVFTLVNNGGATINYAGTNFAVNGNWTQNGTFNITGKTLTLGQGIGTFNCSGDFNATTGVGSVLVSKGSGGSLTLATGCNLTADMSTDTVWGAITVPSGSSLTATGNWVSGPVTNAGTITVNGTTFNSGTTGTITNSGTLAIPNGTSLTLFGFVNTGTVTFPGANITVYSTWSQAGVFNLSGKTLTFSGGANTNFSCTGDFNATSGVAAVIVGKASAPTFTLMSGCTLAADFSTNTGYAFVTVQAGASLTSTGNWVSNTITNAGTITINGSSCTILNLGTFGHFVNTGTFNAPAGGTMSVATNWTNTGTFNHRNGTVSFTDANHIITGSTQFYNLTFATPTVARTTTFVTVGTDTAAHRYWRIYATANGSTSQISMAEAQLLDVGGVNRVGSGTVSASQAGVSWPVSNSVDGNPATFWSNYTGGSGYPQWWAYDFGLGNAFSIASARITARNDGYYYEAPTVFELQFSDDQSTWKRKGLAVNTVALGMAWSQAGQTQTFTVDTTPYVTTVLGTLTMAGQAGKLLTLAPDAAGYQWHIDARGTRTLGYLSVSDSSNDNSCPMYAGTTSNGGNNTNWAFLAAQACVPLVPTSYANPGGSGERRHLINITQSGLMDDWATNPQWYQNFVNGITDETGIYFTGSAVNGYLEFDFGTDSFIIDEVKFHYQLSYSATTQGQWQWQGCSVSCVDIGAPFTLGGSAPQTITAMFGTTTPYPRFRLKHLSGATSSGPWLYEFQFKISALQSRSTGTKTSYSHALGMGDRRALMTTLQDPADMLADPTALIDGLFATGATWFHTDVHPGNSITFDFGTSAIVDEVALFSSGGNVSIGDWKWRASNNYAAGPWTDLSASMTVKNWWIVQFRQLNTNTTGAYRYYQMYSTSDIAGGAWLQEYFFRLGPPTVGVRHRIRIF